MPHIINHIRLAVSAIRIVHFSLGDESRMASTRFTILYVYRSPLTLHTFFPTKYFCSVADGRALPY